MSQVKACVNGRDETFEPDPAESLLDTLRFRLHLRGVKDGCREGHCGACTVIIDGVVVDSCLYFAQAADGRTIETAEGLKDSVGLAVQDAMAAGGGIQCGFCTPGMVTSLTALLRQYPDPDDNLIREAIAGNLCRCTGYAQIVEAALAAAARLRRSAA
jgi:aerobic carbon-monoxide dehydrogenase small subunit